jgi:histidine triad (HIT) family protein
VTAVADCLFCHIIAGAVPAHIVYADETVVAFLDHRPVFKGHTLVAPREHVVTMAELSPALSAVVFGLAQRCAAAMVDSLGAQGSWVSVNNTVSQSVPHLHVHVVPRTKGDGLRGFFWPRQKYASDDEMAEFAARVAAGLPPELP